MYKILLIEDDQEINRLICEYLSGLGYEIDSENNGISGLRKIKSQNKTDLILLDLMLPLKSGDMLLKDIREFTDTPVIILSAKTMVQTKIDLIRAGADDYITKPFDLDEMAARIEAVIKRCRHAPEHVQNRQGPDRDTFLSYKNMVIDREAKTVTVCGHTLELTSKEYSILELLLMNRTKLFSKANLYESIWNEPYYAEDNTLKVHMSNLRSKIRQYDDEEYIETVWRMGYKLAKWEEPAHTASRDLQGQN